MLPAEFRPSEYQEIHRDLRGFNSAQLREHYLEYGRSEKRPYLWKHVLPADFSVTEYKEIHDDIEAFTDAEARRHYVERGTTEKRPYRWEQVLPADFDVHCYKEMNGDLNPIDAVGLKRHYFMHGKAERRPYIRRPQNATFIEPTVRGVNPDDRTTLPAAFIRARQSSLYHEVCRFIRQSDNQMKTVTMPFQYQEYPVFEYAATVSFRDAPLQGPGSSIPPVIHTVVLNDHVSDVLNSLRHHYPGFEIRAYRSHHEMESYLRTHFGEYFVFLNDCLCSSILQQNFFKICLLYNEGGIYWDAHHACDSARHCTSLQFIHTGSHPEFLACSKSHPIMKAYLDVVLQHIYFEIHGTTPSDVMGSSVFGHVLALMRQHWTHWDDSLIRCLDSDAILGDDAGCNIASLWRRRQIFSRDAGKMHLKLINSKNIHVLLGYYNTLMKSCDTIIPLRISDMTNRTSLVAFQNEPLDHQIPCTIHKVWANDTKEQIPGDIWDCVYTWETRYADHQMRIYDKRDIVKYILEHYGRVMLYIYESLLPYAYRADLFRALVLYHEGGIYTDIKQSCLQQINHVDLDFLIIHEKHRDWSDCLPIDFPSVQNCFLMCPKNHPYIKAYLDLMIQNIIEESYNTCEIDITGPIVFGRAMHFIRKQWRFHRPHREKRLIFDFDQGALVVCDEDHSNVYVNHRSIHRVLDQRKRMSYFQAWYTRTVFIQPQIERVHMKTINEIDFHILGQFVAVWFEYATDAHPSAKNLQLYHMIIYDKCHRTFLCMLPQDVNEETFVLTINNDYACESRRYTRSDLNSIFHQHHPVMHIRASSEEHNVLPMYHEKSILSKSSSPIDLYAIYFPQFHEFTENNENFYEGFTDIHNLDKYLKDFENLRCIEPITIHKTSYPSRAVYNLSTLLDYDLIRRADIIQRQVDLSAEYGMRGFAMYWYWFTHNDYTNHHSIMDQVVQLFFSHKIDMKDQHIFFLWANENWTNNIALSSGDRLIENIYDEKSMNDHIRDLMTYFEHSVYLKIDNKPVFGIHHPFFLQTSELHHFRSLLSRACLQHGFDGVHMIINTMAGSDDTCTGYYVNPNYKQPALQASQFNPKFGNYIMNYARYIQSSQHFPSNEINTVMFDFDNRARLHTPNRLVHATFIMNNSDYEKKQLLHRVRYNYQHRRADTLENICLINAWNEWGEKMAIEPSEDFGFYYLNLLRSVLMD